jgi:apolipoprotein N-acyltransferase
LVSRAGAAAAGGLTAAFSLPPWGWWPLAWVGVAVLLAMVGGLPTKGRAVVGASFGIGFFGPGLWWMSEFHVLGAALVVLAKSALMAVVVLLTPPGRWRWLALPGALTLAEAIRAVFPFGGVPVAGMALGQVGGPLGSTARVGGELAVLGLTAAVGSAIGLGLARRWLGAATAAAVVLAGVGLAAVAPDGGAGPRLTTAVVQGGGRRGFRAVESDPETTFRAQLAASQAVAPPVGLVLWPEDVIDVEGPIASSPEGEQAAGLARRAGATLVAGVTQDAGGRRFLNAAVAWSPDGVIVARYDKVKRVPFGEYVPGRALFDRLADLSAVPRDAVAGRGSGLVRTPAGDLAVTISYEVFFATRARGAVRAGGRLLAVPTNAASYRTSQVPAQEMAAARLRAIESGRDLVQAAPTGYSAHIDNRGRVLDRSALGHRQVLQRTVTLRSGRTWYVRAGNLPVVALAALAVVAAWALHRRSFSST